MKKQYLSIILFAIELSVISAGLGVIMLLALLEKHQTMSTYVQYWSIGPLLLFFMAVSPLFILFSYTHPEPPGTLLDKRQCPALYSFVNHCASLMDYNSEIAEILMVPGLTVSVYVEPNLNRLTNHTIARLYIGIELYRILSIQELAAVIGHEIAHIMQPQTQEKSNLAYLTNLTQRLNGGLIEEEFAGNHIPSLPARFLSKRFRKVLNSMNDEYRTRYSHLEDQMETDADNVSSKTFGSIYLLSAILKINAISLRLRVYHEIILPYVAQKNFRPENYWAGFVALDSIFAPIDEIYIENPKLALGFNPIVYDTLDNLTLRRVRLLKMRSYLGEATIENKETDILPESTLLRAERFLLKSYGIEDSKHVDTDAYLILLKNMRHGLFAKIKSHTDILQIIEEIIAGREQKAQQEEIFLIGEPGIETYVFPTNRHTSEYVYSSPINRCPVCNHPVNEGTKVCPRCQDIISE